MAATTLKISRERKELISKYATVAINLYGVITIDEFVDIFNHYEEAVTTWKEAFLALKRLAKTDEVEYSISGDIISGPDFQPHFIDYDDTIQFIRANQEGKPHYLPNKEEFLKFIDCCYREPEKPYTELKAFILKHKLTTNGEGIHGVDNDLMKLHKMIQLGAKAVDELNYFTQRGYQYKDMDNFNAFNQLLMNVHNNTRMFFNNGFTPSEIFEKYERPYLKPLPKEPFNFQSVQKIGRNDPCPCGSGLKFKKCHGR